MILDVMRTSASRPELLKISTETLMGKIKFSGKLRFWVHEDVINRRGSDECIRYLQEESPMPLHILEVDDPPVTQIMSMTWLIGHMESRYFLNWEDDYEALRTIDLDLICKIMDENGDVNQIAFHKRSIYTHRYSWPKKQVERSGTALVTNPHWAFTPAVWRKSFIMDYWQPPYEAGANPVWWLNPKVKRSNSMRTAKWIVENSGHYFLGEFGEPAFCYHIGGGKSLREGDYKFDD